MKLLLDTSPFLWWVTEDGRLGPRARAALSAPDNAVFVSAVSAWEIAIKRSVGKLTFTGDVADWIEHEDFIELPVRVVHAIEAESLPLHHQDPFDRMLVAQSRHEDMVLVTGDRAIARYDLRLLPANA